MSTSKSLHTRVIICSCKHESQDKLYGKGMRVFNPFVLKSGGIKYRCTVCLKERE